jgi:hypothetical protein
MTVAAKPLVGLEFKLQLELAVLDLPLVSFCLAEILSAMSIPNQIVLKKLKADLVQ